MFFRIYLGFILNQRSSQVNEEKTQKLHHFRVENFQSNSRIPPFSLQLPQLPIQPGEDSTGSHPHTPHPPPSTTIHHHPPPSTTIHHHPPPSTWPHPGFRVGFPRPFGAESSGAADGVPWVASRVGVVFFVEQTWEWRKHGKKTRQNHGENLIQSNNDATKTSPICGGLQSFPSILHSFLTKKSYKNNARSFKPSTPISGLDFQCQIVVFFRNIWWNPLLWMWRWSWIAGDKWRVTCGWFVSWVYAVSACTFRQNVIIVLCLGIWKDI